MFLKDLYCGHVKSRACLGKGFTTIVAFVASVDQDQAAQNVQPDL